MTKNVSCLKELKGRYLFSESEPPVFAFIPMTIIKLIFIFMNDFTSKTYALPDIEEIFTLFSMWISYLIVQSAVTGLKLQIEKFSF
jgi:hypothetical protein